MEARVTRRGRRRTSRCTSRRGPTCAGPGRPTSRRACRTWFPAVRRCPERMSGSHSSVSGAGRAREGGEEREGRTSDVTPREVVCQVPCLLVGILRSCWRSTGGQQRVSATGRQSRALAKGAKGGQGAARSTASVGVAARRCPALADRRRRSSTSTGKPSGEGERDVLLATRETCCCERARDGRADEGGRYGRQEAGRRAVSVVFDSRGRGQGRRGYQGHAARGALEQDKARDVQLESWVCWRRVAAGGKADGRGGGRVGPCGRLERCADVGPCAREPLSGALAASPCARNETDLAGLRRVREKEAYNEVRRTGRVETTGVGREVVVSRDQERADRVGRGHGRARAGHSPGGTGARQRARRLVSARPGGLLLRVVAAARGVGVGRRARRRFVVRRPVRPTFAGRMDRGSATGGECKAKRKERTHL